MVCPITIGRSYLVTNSAPEYRVNISILLFFLVCFVLILHVSSSLHCESLVVHICIAGLVFMLPSPVTGFCSVCLCVCQAGHMLLSCCIVQCGVIGCMWHQSFLPVYLIMRQRERERERERERGD